MSYPILAKWDFSTVLHAEDHYWVLHDSESPGSRWTLFRHTFNWADRHFDPQVLGRGTRILRELHSLLESAYVSGT